MNRRFFLSGLVSALAAPAIVHAGNIMKVRPFEITPIHPCLGPFVDPDQFSIELLRRIVETMKEHTLAGSDIDYISGLCFRDGIVSSDLLDKGRMMFKAEYPNFRMARLWPEVLS